jgi:hypothetical protein
VYGIEFISYMLGTLHSGFRIRIDLLGSGYGSGSSIFSNCGSGFGIRIPDPDPGFDDIKLKKLQLKKIYFVFDQKLQFTYL